MTATVKRFRSDVLRAGGSGRKLKKRLDECLRGYLEEHTEPAKQELVAAFGPPEELARLLMNQFPEKERKRRRMVRKILLGVSAAVTVLILIFAVYVFFLKEIPMTVVNDYDVIGEESVPEMTGNGK